MHLHDVEDAGHGHGHGHEHDDERGQDLPGETLKLKSVGIDIGSTTSHLLVSLVTLHRQGDRLSSQFKVVARETVYESPIILTPYCHGLTIDTEALRLFIEASYRQAGLTPEGIDTGAVITTGEAAKKDNAAAITALFSAWAGRFVCASAGPHLEARIAAYGSGAVRRSLESGEPVLNLDVGGGSTKLALACDGVVIATAALEAGARLVAIAADGSITRLEEPGRKILQSMGLAPQLGDKLAIAEQEAMARTLARCVREFVSGDALSPLTRELMITSPLALSAKTRTLVLSGGVSEYFYGRELKSFGDLGLLLARALREELRELPLQVMSGERGIRSTVILAAEAGPGVDVISLDGIATGELNYVDIGAKLGKAGVVPVMVKSLLFRP